MAAAQMLTIIRRAVLDDEFRASLFADPDHALQGYALSAKDAQAVRRLKPEHLHAFVGSLVMHHCVPIRASRRFAVITDGMQSLLAPGLIPIVVGPEIVFGNGIHATTQLCLAELERRVKPGMTVLDMGTGTGILAIAAVKLGAARVLALDILHEAVEAARRNVEQNQVLDHIQVELGSLAEALAAPFQADIVVANILAPVIIDLAGRRLIDTLKPDGMMMVSGFTARERHPVEAALRQGGFSVSGKRDLRGWEAVRARRAGRGWLARFVQPRVLRKESFVS